MRLPRLMRWIVRDHGTPKSGTLTVMTIERHIQDLLARQRADAAAKDAESWRWGNTGAIVRRAARDCETILLPVMTDQPLRDYFENVLRRLAALTERYRRDADDAEGYGLGTVRELEEAIKTKARLVGIKI